MKRTTKELIKGYKARFSSDFGENKKAVSGVIPTTSKKVRNSVAGYISRLMKRSEKK